jgi:hypothetical protein
MGRTVAPNLAITNRSNQAPERSPIIQKKNSHLKVPWLAPEIKQGKGPARDDLEEKYQNTRPNETQDPLKFHVGAKVKKKYTRPRRRPANQTATWEAAGDSNLNFE